MVVVFHKVAPPSGYIKIYYNRHTKYLHVAVDGSSVPRGGTI